MSVLMKREERYQILLEHFRKEMPNVTTELEFGSEFQLLVAVILSAQCTDKRVNQVTPELFRRYPTAEAMGRIEECGARLYRTDYSGTVSITVY